MNPMRLTADELKQQIAEVVLPLIREHASKDIADVVKVQVEAMLTAVKATRPAYVEGLLGDDGKSHKETGESASLFGAYVRALAGAKNDKERAVKVARAWAREHPPYEKVARALELSIEKAMSAGDPTAGGFLVPIEFSADVIELLRASAVVRSLGPTTIPMRSGTLKVPKITAGSAAAYVGESVNIGKTEVDTGQITLTFKKLAALVPVSNDLIRYAAPSADAIVRDDLIRSMATREDLAFIRNDGTSGTPKGLKNWIHADNKFAANGTVNLANVTTDLGTAMQKLMDADIPLIMGQNMAGAIDARPGWLFHPRAWKYLTTVQTGLGTHAFRDEMLRGTLWGYPYRVSTQVENTTVYFVAFAHTVIGESLGLIVDASQEAAYHDGNAVVAAFSQDQTVIRVLSEHDFAMRHDKGGALITGVTWGA